LNSPEGNASSNAQREGAAVDRRRSDSNKGEGKREISSGGREKRLARRRGELASVKKDRQCRRRFATERDLESYHHKGEEKRVAYCSSRRRNNNDFVKIRFQSEGGERGTAFLIDREKEDQAELGSPALL